MPELETFNLSLLSFQSPALDQGRIDLLCSGLTFKPACSVADSPSTRFAKQAKVADHKLMEATISKKNFKLLRFNGAENTMYE